MFFPFEISIFWNKLCKEEGVSEPVIELSNDWFTIIFKRKNVINEINVESQSATQSDNNIMKLLLLLKANEKSAKELRNALNLSHRATFRQNYLHPALKEGYIEYTIPEKPVSRLQKYRLTDKGKTFIKHYQNS